jgi:hypothetical protein
MPLLDSPQTRTLYHFSEDPAIELFVPRPPVATPDAEPLVWGIDADHASLYCFPRDCPRVCFAARADSSVEEIERFLGLTTARLVIAIEGEWLERMRSTRLYRYHLPSETFMMIDEGAGYHVSREPVVPSKVEPVGDLIEELVDAGVELRITPSLWLLHDAVAASSLRFSMIRMRNASPR